MQWRKTDHLYRNFFFYINEISDGNYKSTLDNINYTMTQTTGTIQTLTEKVHKVTYTVLCIRRGLQTTTFIGLHGVKLSLI